MINMIKRSTCGSFGIDDFGIATSSSTTHIFCSVLSTISKLPQILLNSQHRIPLHTKQTLIAQQHNAAMAPSKDMRRADPSESPSPIHLWQPRSGAVEAAHSGLLTRARLRSRPVPGADRLVGQARVVVHANVDDAHGRHVYAQQVYWMVGTPLQSSRWTRRGAEQAAHRPRTVRLGMRMMTPEEENCLASNMKVAN